MMKRWTRRERYSVYILAVFLCVTGVVMYVVNPVIDEKKNLERRLKAKKKTLNQMLVLKSEYEDLRKKAEASEKRIRRRPRNFRLNTFLNELADRTGIKDNIDYMKPSKSERRKSQYKISIVDMKIKGINLKKLTPFLHKIETSRNMLFIKRVSITKKRKEEGFVDAVLQVETFDI